MRYSDYNEAKLGDEVAIDDIYKGVVVASLDTDEYSARCPREEWAHLGTGIVVDTNFGGGGGLLLCSLLNTSLHWPLPVDLEICFPWVWWPSQYLQCRW